MSKFTLMRPRGHRSKDTVQFDLHLLRLDSLPSTTQAATVCVYDYDLYVSSQVKGQAADAHGFWETDRSFFDGSGGTKLPGALQRHTVAEGTGLLGKVDLTFHHRGGNPAWYVDDVSPSAPLPSGGPELVLTAPMKRGSTHVFSPVLRMTWPGKDFEDVRTGAVTKRRIVVRVLAPDGKTILLASQNPAHCQAAPQFFVAELSTPASPPSRTPTQPPGVLPPLLAPPRTPPSPDPSGYYVELVDGLDAAAKTGLLRDDDERAIAGSGMYLGAAGDGIVGWYYVLETDVRAAAGFQNKLSDAKLDETLGLTVGRLFNASVIVAHRDLELPNTSQLPASHRLPVPDRENVMPVLFSNPGSPDPDPLELMDGRIYGDLAEVYQGYLEVLAGPFDSMTLKLHLKIGGRKRTFRFSRLHGRTRLPYVIFKVIMESRGRALGVGMENHIKTEAWPIPTGTREWLMQDAAKGLLRICEDYTEFMENGGNLPTAVRRDAVLRHCLRAADVVNKFLRDFSYYADDLVQLLTATVVGQTIYVGERNRVLREVLYEMLGMLLDLDLLLEHRERGTPEADWEWLVGLPRHEPLAQPFHNRQGGLAAIGIQPGNHSYRYEVRFSAQSLSGGALVKGAGGGFKVTIKRFRSMDVSSATPDYSVDYVGAFFGIGAGAGTGFDYTAGASKSGTGGSAGGPVSCDLYSVAKLEAQDFNHATFTTGAIVGPTGKFGTGVGVGGSAGFSKTFFELRITRRSPNVVMSATLTKTPSDPKLSVPGIGSMKKRWDEMKKDTKEGKVRTFSIGVDLLAVSRSWGVLAKSWGAVPKPDKDNPPERGPGEAVTFIHRGVAAMAFEVGKADIRPFLVARLDLLLALYRRMFEQPGWVRIEGYASPEWKGATDKGQAKTKNQDLAERRTANTLAVIEQAIGKPGGPIVHPDKDVRHAGYGDAFQSRIITDADGPRRDSTNTWDIILDPFCADARGTKKGIDRKGVEQLVAYPKMRRVDISANGVFIIRLGAR
ncbi:MAG: hypothetical protein KC619_13885 [Myxococcales bacterium]|nr:hypothetical protein [Myxococcales bacterium]